jgi:hypothetical protein
MCFICRSSSCKIPAQRRTRVKLRITHEAQKLHLRHGHGQQLNLDAAEAAANEEKQKQSGAQDNTLPLQAAALSSFMGH